MVWDPFTVLGLPQRFDLDRATIERAYLECVPAAHPDAGEDTGADAAALNRARHDLLDPESRANVLLVLRNGPSREADRSLPPGFLAQMMQEREALDAARARGDAPAVEGFARWAEAAREEQVRAVAAAFARNDPGAHREIRMRLNAWRYIERMLEAMEAEPASPADA